MLTEIDKDRGRSDTRIRTLQAEGFRIVDDGSTGGHEDSEESKWKVVDWETREVLAEGVRYESYEAAGDETWYHIDHVANGEKFVAAVMKLESLSGLPKSLADALTEWTEEHVDDAVQLVDALPQKDAVTGLIELAASHGYGINFQPTSEGTHWRAGWTRGRHGGWFGFTGDNLAEVAQEAATSDFPALLVEHSKEPNA